MLLHGPHVVQRRRGRNRARLLADARQHGRRIPGRANEDGQRAAARLLVREVHERRRLLPEREVLPVLHDADDLAGAMSDEQRLAHRATVRPQQASQPLVDDDARRRARIGVIEGATVAEHDAQRLEVGRVHDREVHRDARVGRVRRDRRASDVQLERNPARHTDRVDPGRAPEPRQKPRHGFATARFVIGRRAQVDSCNHNPFRVEAEINPVDVGKASQAQRGADEQHET